MLEFNQLFVSEFYFSKESGMIALHPKEKKLKQLELFPEVIQNAAQNHSPAVLLVEAAL
jgi:arginyl-tRNA synthetase